MWNDNHLSLTNFRVKTSLSETSFQMNTMLDVQIFWGHCKHGAMLGVVTMVPCGVLNAMQNKHDFSCPNQFHFILFFKT